MTRRRIIASVVLIAGLVAAAGAVFAQFDGGGRGRGGRGRSRESGQIEDYERRVQELLDRVKATYSRLL